MAAANPFRFSTKYQDPETDLLYYGYRYYTPTLGRWLSRDPADEEGAGRVDLYPFVHNGPTGLADRDGRDIIQIASEGGPTPGVLATRYVTGETVKGIIVGTFRYPRRGQCGCWKRNVYADFTPILTQHLRHYRYRSSYKDDFSMDADVLEPLAEMRHFLEPMKVADPATVLLAVLSAWQRRLDTVYFTVTWEFNAWGWDLSPISWRMGSTYFKKGESWKISRLTCKPRLEMLDRKDIQMVLDRLIPRFRKIDMSVEGPVTTTITVN